MGLLSFVPTWSNLTQGQISLVLLLGVVLVWWGQRRGKMVEISVGLRLGNAGGVCFSRGSGCGIGGDNGEIVEGSLECE